MSYLAGRLVAGRGRWRMIGVAALAVAAALVLFRPAAGTAFPTGTAVVRELPPTSSWDPGRPFGLPDCAPAPSQAACAARYAADRAAAAAAADAAAAELGRLDPAAPESELATAQARLDAARLALEAAARRERAARQTASRPSS